MSTEENQGQPLCWAENFRLHSYEVDFRRQASVETVCRFFLEAAWNHAEALGFGFRHLAGQGKVWVLSRLLVEVDKYPRWGETVTVRTWPKPSKSVFAMRDFQLSASSGEVMGCGSSAWLVLDAQTRRPQRPERVLAHLAVVPTGRATQRDPEKLPELHAGHRLPSFPVLYSDLDVNNHVNSGRYVRWMLDSYPAEFHAYHSVSRLEVNYLGETHGGERLFLTTDPATPDGHGHSLFKEASGQEVCRAWFHWKDDARD